MKPAYLRRIERLLVLIPYVARFGVKGVELTKAAKFAGYESVQELRADLEVAQQIAVPPEAPDDFIDIHIDDKVVSIVLPQGFKRPPRLTILEAGALIAAARPLEKSGKALEAALTKLRKALPPGAEDQLEPIERMSAIETPDPSEFQAALEVAIAKRLEISMDYVSAYNGKRSTKVLEPREVFLHKSRWYLAAWEPASLEEKLFRLDRAVEVRIGTRPFGEHKGAPQTLHERELLYNATGAEQEVEIRFTREIAPLIEERWGELEKDEDGSATLTIRAAGTNYVVGWVLAFGGEAQVIEPAGARDALRERVEELTAMYARG